MSESEQILSEISAARRDGRREDFLKGVNALVNQHRNWLEYRFGYDESVEDGLQQAVVKAIEAADFDAILHPDAYFKQVAENYIRTERRKRNRAESLDALEEAAFEPSDPAQNDDPRERMIIEENATLLRRLDLPGLMAGARRALERKSELQAYLLQRRADVEKVSYSALAEELGMKTDTRSLTRLRVQHVRAKQNYNALFVEAFRRKAGKEQEECESAFRHYLCNMERYPPLDELGSDAGATAGGES
ncbi:sigma-70 family RNA polymerase sigma factor [Candidatus Sumerlaeota bacterium]|nr:sigma-70 family RNA polymerase sigma factor [Candidatus Sumerlaeota bacterium]